MTTVTGYRISPQQAAWWRLTRNDPCQAYGFHLQCLVHSPFDPAALTERLAALTEEEEILRTRLQALPGMEWPVQVIDAAGAPALRVEDWRAQPPAQQQAQLQALLNVPPASVSPLGVTVCPLTADAYALTLSAPASHADPISLRRLAARLLGEAPPVQTLQYADYAEWRQTLLEDDPQHPGLQHWQARQTEPMPAPDLGLLRQRAGARFEIGSEALSLSEEEVAALHALAQTLGCALEDLLFAAWLTWLARLSGQARIETAVLEPGRGDELDQALGPYEQALPVRVDVDLSAALPAQLPYWLAARTRAAGWRDYYPGQPAPDYVFGFRPAAELPVEICHESGLGGYCLLQLICREAADGALHCRFHHDRSRLGEAAIACALEQWQQLLRGLVRDPQQVLGRFDLLGPHQHARLAPPPAAPVIRPVSVVELIEAQAAARPEAPALADGGGILRYGEYNRRANRLARRLQEAGIGSGDTVGILLPRGNDALVALLAILKTGAAYLALDPGYPDDRLRFMLEDSGVKWVISRQDTAAPASVERLAVDDPTLATLPGQNLEQTLHPAQPAYLIYTSGSTGQPKAVEINHSNLSHSTQLRLAFYPTPVRAYLLLSSLAFDSSVAGIFWTLSQGGLLVLPGSGEELALDRLTTLIRQHRVSHGLSLPSLYDALLDYAAPADLASLDTWIVAGEVCREALVGRHREMLPGVSLVNEYGPTEATVWASADFLDGDSTAEGVSIGRPLPTMILWLLNQQGTPAALGEPGEIHLGGPQLARGYRSRPEQTAAAFREHPALPGAPRLYRTGDLARWRLDGRLRFLGRRDHQVKIGGFRVELGEIEQALHAHPEVAEAVVVAQTRHDRQRLVAYVVARHGGRSETNALRDHLAGRLPPYMVPSVWVALDAVPRSPNGKLDVQALPDPDSLTRPSRVAPRNPLEAALQTICAEVLRRPDIGVLDDFFKIGGDSILSLQMVARALQRGIRISAKQVFERRTIAALAEVAEWTSPPDGDAAEASLSTAGLDQDALDALLAELADAR